MKTSVRIRNLSKSYGKNAPVLDGIDLEIDEREFVVLVGPSGCGKSTLLRMIAGLEDVTSGEIWIGDRLVNDVEPADRGIAMVFQDYALYPHMTVRENLEFGLKMKKRDRLSKEERERRIRSATEMLELSPLLDRKPGQLSGGQRQRVAIGRALVKEPKVFLFDEPLSNLDAQLRAGMRIEIAALHRRLGSTSVYVTHDQIEAMTLADRLVVLKDGIVQQAGPPTDLYRDPDNRFVASFLGTPGMNFLDGRLDVRDGEQFFVFPNGETEGQIPLNFLHGIPAVPMAERGKGSITLGIRPESIRVARTIEGLGAPEVVDEARPGGALPGWEAAAPEQRASSPQGPSRLEGSARAEALQIGASGQALRLEGQVLMVEPHGHEVQLVIELGAARWVVRAPATNLKPGERCWLELDREALYWFDAQGRRLRAPEIAEEAERLPTLALEEEARGKGLKIRREEAPGREREPGREKETGL